MSSHSLTNFAVNRNHVSTIMSEVEILSSFARDLCSTAQHFCVHQWLFHSEIWAIRSRRILGIAKLHHRESIHHWQSDKIFHLLLLLDQSSIGMCRLQLLCPGWFSPIQTASDHWWHWHPNLQVKMSLRKSHTLFPNLRAIQQNSSHHSIDQNSSHRSIRHHSNHHSRKCQWDMSVQIPEFSELDSDFEFSRPEWPVFVFLPLCEPLAPLVPLNFPLDFPLFSLLLPFALTLGPWLALFAFARRLLACVLACIAVSLEMCSAALTTPITRTRWPCSFARRERVDRISIHGIWVSTSTRVTRLGITNFRTELRLHVRHDVQACILDCSQAIWEKYQMFFKLLRHHWLKTSKLDLVVQLVHHVARHVGLPAFDPGLEFQKRALARRSDRSQNVSSPSSCRRIISLLQSPPCLQRILPRVGDNVVRLVTRESHECCVHLLQHKLQVMNSSVHIRFTRQELEINCCRRDFRRLFSGPLQHHLRLLDHTSEECTRLLRPLLEILLTASELLRASEAFHMDETCSIFPNLSCREIVDCSHCIGKSRFCCHLSSQREQLLLKLRHNLLHRHRNQYSSEFLKLVQQAIAATRQVNTFRPFPGHSSWHVKLPTAPPAFHSTRLRQATTIQQTRSTREHDTPAERK